MLVHIHPENHSHDGHIPRIRNLLRAAEKGRAVVLFEGAPFVDPSSCTQLRTVTVQSHGLYWTGPPSFVNGLEQISETVRFHWAGLLRLVMSSGFSGQTELQHAGDCGMQVVRQLCIMLAKMHDLPSLVWGKLRSVLGDNLIEFATALCKSFKFQTGTDLNSYQMANDLAERKGRWPGKVLTFNEVTHVCYELMRYVPDKASGSVADRVEGASCDWSCELSAREDELLQMVVDSIIICEREHTFANSIRRMMDIQLSKTSGGDANTPSSPIPIHVVVGASHACGLLDDAYVATLGLDLQEFKNQQKRVATMTSVSKKKYANNRLWDLVPCRLFHHDPFLSSIEP